MKFDKEKISELAQRSFEVIDEDTKRQMVIDQLESHLEGLSDDELEKEQKELVWKEMAAEEERIVKKYYPDIA